MECLLDTCATVNVMSWERFNQLGNVELSNTDDKICKRQYLGDQRQIDGRYHIVNFTIVQHMSPDVIGGIGLKKQFGIELH